MLSNFFSTFIVSLTLISTCQSFIFRKSEATAQVRDLPSNLDTLLSQTKPQVKKRVIPFGKRLDLTIEIPQSGVNYTVSTGSVTINRDLKVVSGNSTNTTTTSSGKTSDKISVDGQTLVKTDSTSTDSDSETTDDSDIVAVWGQCGGDGYTGSTTCEEGTSCVATSEWYSECKPVTLATSSCDDPVAVWGQCGGSDFTGSTCCASGNTCVKQSEWYSQCTPATDASDIAASSVSTSSATTETTEAASTTTKAITTTSSAAPQTTTSDAPETTTTTPDAPETTTATTSDVPKTTATTTTKQKEVQTTTTTTQAAIETTTTTVTTTTTTTHKPHTTTTTTTSSEPAQTSSPGSGSSEGDSGSDSGEVTGGFATFYYQEGAAGACGTVHSDSDFIVAQQTETYDGGVNCGKTVKITNIDNGKSVQAVVADECPGCPNANSLDLSVATFDAIADEATGIVPITWEYV